MVLYENGLKFQPHGLVEISFL